MMRPLVVVTAIAVAVASISPVAVFGSHEPQSSSPTGSLPNLDARSDCGHEKLPPLATDMTGPTADKVEELQGRYEDEPGFRGVVSSGDEFWVVVDEVSAESLMKQLSSDGIQVALSCVDSGLIKSAKSAVSDAAMAPGDYSSVGYNVLTDSVDVITTLDPIWVTNRIGDAASKAGSTLRIQTSDKGGVNRSAGRLADTEPFFGGGRIHISGNGCSTGFYINSTTRGTVMLTAGHCTASDGVTVWNGSDTLTLGTIEGRSFPDPDLATMDGKSYAARSFSANNDTSSKAISNAVNPGTGATYCQMGSYIQRVCSSYSSLDTQFCDPGCTNHLAFTSRLCSSGPLALSGDSGGGVMREASNGTLGARGIVIAAGPIGTGNVCVRYDHILPTILAYYHATVVLTP